VPAIDVQHLAPAQRSLRVAVVTETYPPEINGVAATISRVVEGLRERGHALQLVRPRQEPGDAGTQSPGFVEVLMRGLPIPRYPQLRMGLPSRRALLRLWATARPDVVHIVTEGPLGYSALQAATQLRLPVVSDFRTNFHAYSRHYGIAWLRNPIMGYLRKFHNRTACTMVPTDALRGELMLNGFANLRVVSRGVDTRLYDPARRSEDLRQTWGAGPADTVLLCVGRLAPEKNLGLLVEAFEALHARDPRARLVLVGDGPERAALQARCPLAHFAGLRRGEDLAAHYASADAFVFPSMTETFGNVLTEAMASGLPAVAFDHAAAHQWLRHGENGLVVALDDGAAFCAATARLAGERPWLREMGHAARQTALRLDWRVIVEQVETEYLRALAAPQTGTRPALRGALPA
jgi:glycosyltransferase involved in cell wall biosynthesis